MRGLKTIAGLAFMASCVLMAAPAFATEFCDIKKTRDGFVALRAAPSPSGKLVGKMRVGDEVLYEVTVASKGDWSYVTWWKGSRFRKGGYEFGKPTARGWVNSKLIKEECG